MTIEMEYSSVRQQYLSDYQNLREHFLNTAKLCVSSGDLNILKMTYSRVIKSTRVSDNIHSLEELLRILEKRNALSYDNIEPLKHISSDFVKNPVLERALMDYESRNSQRTPLPPCNVYNLPSGKYSSKGLRMRNSAASNRLVINENAHFFESLNDDDAHFFNLSSENHQRNLSSPEEFFINETEHFLQNIFPKVSRDRGDTASDRFWVMKICKKICSKIVVCVAGAFFIIGSLILLITIINVTSIKSLVGAPEYESQPGVSGIRTNFNQSQQGGEEIHARMTLFTTQPAFQLTLPGSIRFGPTTNKNTLENDVEHIRMVLLEVSERLGRHWRNVARFLGVKENDIDELDHENWPLKEKAFKALQIFQSKCDPLQWKTKLKRALDKARRRDLMELVDQLSEKH